MPPTASPGTSTYSGPEGGREEAGEGGEGGGGRGGS